MYSISNLSHSYQEFQYEAKVEPANFADDNYFKPVVGNYS